MHTNAFPHVQNRIISSKDTKVKAKQFYTSQFLQTKMWTSLTKHKSQVICQLYAIQLVKLNCKINWELMKASYHPE